MTGMCKKKDNLRQIKRLKKTSYYNQRIAIVPTQKEQ